MPWKTVDLMDEKLRFIHLARSGRFTITELRQDFGISARLAISICVATNKMEPPACMS